jgi:hypothetical protein
VQCVESSDFKPFQFVNALINGLMLSHAGITEDPDTGKSHINCCTDCRSDLQKGRLPRYALKDSLYYGSLPKELQDLTWVEEMVCAKYCNTAHVTHFYGSTDPNTVWNSELLCEGYVGVF